MVSLQALGKKNRAEQEMGSKATLKPFYPYLISIF